MCASKFNSLRFHLHLTRSCYFFSGLNRIMKPNQIKSVFGLHSIADFKSNSIESNAYEMDIEEIVTHPDYRCELAKDDIGKWLHKVLCTQSHKVNF